MGWHDGFRTNDVAASETVINAPGPAGAAPARFLPEEAPDATSTALPFLEG